jgi:hypothetical protein
LSVGIETVFKFWAVVVEELFTNPHWVPIYNIKYNLEYVLELSHRQ